MNLVDRLDRQLRERGFCVDPQFADTFVRIDAPIHLRKKGPTEFIDAIGADPQTCRSRVAAKSL